MNEISTNWAACIVYYQDQESLLNLLASLEQQSLKPGHVFITDNNSIQSLALKNYSFPVQITKLTENKGFAAGANMALKNAINNNFSNLMLLSQDVILDSLSAEQMVIELVSSKGIVFPTMYNRNTNQVFSKGGSVNKLSGTVIANYEQLSTVNGLGPRTRIVSVNKGTGNATEAELVAVIKALTVGTDVGSTNDAFTVAGIAGTIGTDPVYLAVQGTGTIGTSSGDYGTDITLAVVADFDQNPV